MNEKNIKSNLFSAITYLKKIFFDYGCRNGVLVACNELKNYTNIRPAKSYYGTIENSLVKKKFLDTKIRCLMSGTLTENTGVGVLIETIKLLRFNNNSLINKLRFDICGHGDQFSNLLDLAGSYDGVDVVVHGRLSNDKYAELVSCCDIGLALKTMNGPYAKTTFPSKVIEFASNGLLVLTTDISDVRNLFENTARYLTNSLAPALQDELHNIIDNPIDAQLSALAGYNIINDKCSSENVGLDLKSFFYDKN